MATDMEDKARELLVGAAPVHRDDQARQPAVGLGVRVPIGSLYEEFYDAFIHAPIPPELLGEANLEKRESRRPSRSPWLASSSGAKRASSMSPPVPANSRARGRRDAGDRHAVVGRGAAPRPTGGGFAHRRRRRPPHRRRRPRGRVAGAARPRWKIAGRASTRRWRRAGCCAASTGCSDRSPPPSTSRCAANPPNDGLRGVLDRVAAAAELAALAVGAPIVLSRDRRLQRRLARVRPPV